MSYARPGVYINETLNPIAPSVGEEGTARAAFVGVIEGGGPTNLPIFISSWTKYQQMFGGFGAFDLTPHAVYQYFNNGGAGCFVVRAAGSDAVKATLTLKNAADADVLKVDAIGSGVWGNLLTVSVVNKTDGQFDLTVSRNDALGNTTVVESYPGVTVNPAGRNVEGVVNSRSALVRVSYVGPAITAAAPWDASNTPEDTLSPVALAGGSEGVAEADLVAGTKTLDSVTGILDVNLPGVNDTATISPVVTWAEGRGDVFIVVDGLKGDGDTPYEDNAEINATAQQGLVTSLSPSSVVGVYGPWLMADDPANTGVSRLLPPGGFVLGQFARSDVENGVQKAPAGVKTVLRGVREPKVVYSEADLATLNSMGFNAIRSIPGVGICIWGARTTKDGMPDRYISIRRTLIFLKDGLESRTQPAVFEVNDEDLWDYLTSVISQYLQTQWQTGLLSGGSVEEAFYVKCDAENNPPSSADAGVVNVEVGLALSSPAEFIVINIGQSLAGASTTEG